LPKAPRWTAIEAERFLLSSGFTHVRSKGSHRIYLKGAIRVVLPFHGHRILHPKIVRQVQQAIAVA
jgi:predicted RNA binding protein YcfA (HicA-like mRNA interferase family)